jgi:hypothetical protein
MDNNLDTSQLQLNPLEGYHKDGLAAYVGEISN